MESTEKPSAGLQIPSNICWLYEAGRENYISSKYSVTNEGCSLRMCWQCSNASYQLQYRVKRRLSPAYAAEMGHSNPENAWEEWGEWQGNDLSGSATETGSCFVGSLANSVKTTNETFEFPYDFSQYDRIEYQVRVRSLNEKTSECSDWGYGELTVIYHPNVEIASAERQPDGDVLLTVETNWTRGGNRVKGGVVRSDGLHFTPAGDPVTMVGIGPDFEMTLPAATVGNAQAIWVAMTFTTSDGGYGAPDMSVTIGEYESDESVTEPVVTFYEEEHSCFVSIEGVYSDAIITAEWADFMGAVHMADLNAEELIGIDGSGGWSGELIAPPFGIDVTFRVSVAEGTKWRTETITHRTANRKCISLHPLGTEWCVELDRDLSWSTDAVPDVEAVMLAGRQRPKARRGVGGVRTMRASGTFTSPTTDGTDAEWLRKVEWLRSFDGEWIYRNPNGERFKVLVTAVSDSTDTAGITAVSVSMTEVE